MPSHGAGRPEDAMRGPPERGRAEGLPTAGETSAGRGRASSLVVPVLSALVVLLALLTGTLWWLRPPRFELVMVAPEDGGDEHKALPGRAVELKAVLRAPSSMLFDYEWDFGDGKAVERGQVKDFYNLGVRHTYRDARPGALYLAALTVTERDSGSRIRRPYRIHFVELSEENRKAVAIEDGLWALHVNAERRESAVEGQTLRWSRRDSHWRSITALNVLALEVLGHNLRGDERTDSYVEDVRRGLNCLVQELKTCAISKVGDRDPDTNKSTKGLTPVSSPDPVYEAATLLLALAHCGVAQQKVVAVAEKQDELVGRRYRFLAEELVDYLAYAQNDEGAASGGWGGKENADQSTEVNSAYVALGFQAAEKQLGVKTPQWVRAELREDFLKTAQGEDGRFGPTAGKPGVAHTASGIVCLSFCDVGAKDPRIQNAAMALGGNWMEDHLGRGEVMYMVSRAGLTARPGLDQFGTHEWRKEYRPLILDKQKENGLWPAYSRTDETLAASYAMMILQENAVLPRGQTWWWVGVPIGCAVVGGLALGGWVWWRRRRGRGDPSAVPRQPPPAPPTQPSAFDELMTEVRPPR